MSKIVSFDINHIIKSRWIQDGRSGPGNQPILNYGQGIQKHVENIVSINIYHTINIRTKK